MTPRNSLPTLFPLAALSAALLAGCVSNPLGGSSSPAPAATGSDSTYAMPVPTPPPTVPKRTVEYTITSGDSLWKLANEFDTTIREIKEANQMDSDTIIAGKKILIPTNLPDSELPEGVTPTPEAAPDSSASGGTAPVFRTPEPEVLAPPATTTP